MSSVLWHRLLVCLLLLVSQRANVFTIHRSLWALAASPALGRGGCILAGAGCTIAELAGQSPALPVACRASDAAVD